jgi:hypothetical protein
MPCVTSSQFLPFTSGKKEEQRPREHPALHEIHHDNSPKKQQADDQDDEQHQPLAVARFGLHNDSVASVLRANLRAQGLTHQKELGLMDELVDLRGRGILRVTYVAQRLDVATRTR